MRKYQKIVKDNIDLIGEAEESLLYDIDHSEENGAVIPNGYLRCIYVASGAIRMIDENYDFSQIPVGVAETIANMLTAYASCAYDGKLSHDFIMHCFDLSKQIKDNAHYHRMREPLFYS